MIGLKIGCVSSLLHTGQQSAVPSSSHFSLPPANLLRQVKQHHILLRCPPSSWYAIGHLPPDIHTLSLDALLMRCNDATDEASKL
jgi:hypothetical protein